MLIFVGAYHLWPQRLAFRNDYCVRCQAPRRSVEVRSFDVGHIFWVPLLPVGFWRHWTCTVCKRNPHRLPRLKRTLLWRGAFFLISLSVVFWAIRPGPEFEVGIWACRIAAPIGAAVLIAQLLRGFSEPSLRDRLLAVTPANDTACPFCGAALAMGTSERWSCPSCGIVRC